MTTTALAATAPAAMSLIRKPARELLASGRGVSHTPPPVSVTTPKIPSIHSPRTPPVSLD